jgi:AraC family transcriptional regulator of adaptative response / DNA-3-methyladenine glycosylase II
MIPDHATCYRAIVAKDARFDGRLFTGVITTGIYCRPICPARVPKSQNIVFYPSAAAAQDAGLRPCLRCRPETAPDTPAWAGTSATTVRALRLIDQGALDDHGVDHLAMRLGIGERQLRRLFVKHIGASPRAVAQTRRTALAKQLLHETRLPIAQVALASGFRSIRRFNEVFQTLFQRPPTHMRRCLSSKIADEAGNEIALKLYFRPPYDWQSVADFLMTRLYQGIESFNDDTYSRSFMIDGQAGIVQVRQGGPHWLDVGVSCQNIAVLPKVIARVRAAFDQSADMTAINQHLGAHPLLAPLIDARPGLRVPASWDHFEGAVRAVLGQQITVKAAIKLGNHLIAHLGQPLPDALSAGGPISHGFPTPQQVARADLNFMPMPQARRNTLRMLAQAFCDNPDFLVGPFEVVRQRLIALVGIGPWTIDYIGLRVLRDPDAFPASDVALIRAATQLSGAAPITAQSLARTARAWAPWRAYAAQHLWTSLH